MHNFDACYTFAFLPIPENKTVIWSSTKRNNLFVFFFRVELQRYIMGTSSFDTAKNLSL